MPDQPGPEAAAGAPKRSSRAVAAGSRTTRASASVPPVEAGTAATAAKAAPTRKKAPAKAAPAKRTKPAITPSPGTGEGAVLTAVATDAPAVWWAVLLSELAFSGMLVVLAGSLLARRWAAPAGLACAVLFLGLSVSCPLSGHHAYAAWWGVQLTAGAAMVALSAVTLRATRRRR